MNVLAAQPVPSTNDAALSSKRNIAVARAASAVLWAVGFLAVLHARRVATGSEIPLGAGVLLAAYPLIDATAALVERRKGLLRARPYPALLIDGLAIVALLVAALTLHTGSVLIAFGTWAVASGLLQLVQACRSGRSVRVQLPLAVSGGISAIAGVSFAALATRHTASLATLAGYAVLGAVLFLVWTVLDRRSTAGTGRA